MRLAAAELAPLEFVADGGKVHDGNDVDDRANQELLEPLRILKYVLD
jgi:hypothetical protein